MILNVFALIAGSVGIVRLALGGTLAVVSFAAWRRWSRAKGPEARAGVENRAYLLLLLAVFLAGLNLAAWPLLYAVLQSYVPEWPGVMCVYGVTRIGVGSQGPSGFLPVLLAVLQAVRPALLFLTGAWLVLYAAHRRSRTPWLLPTVLAVLAGIGLASSADAAAELSYLAIPKRNDIPAAGCCMVSPAQADSGANMPGAGVPAPWITAAYYLTNLAAVAALELNRRSADPQVRSLVPSLMLAAAAVAASAVYLEAVLTPAVLHTPGHHCVYDLIPRAPLVMLAVAMFVWGTFSVGWAAVARRLARSPEAAPFIAGFVAGILRRGEFGYVASLVLATCALATARG